MARASILFVVLAAAVLGLSSPARAGLGPFYVLRLDAKGKEIGRVHVVAFAGNRLVASDGDDVGRVDPVEGRPLPSALFVLDGLGSVEWDGDGSTGPLAMSGGVVELVRPDARSASDARSGLVWIAAIIAGGVVWQVYRDSFWRRSVSL